MGGRSGDGRGSDANPITAGDELDLSCIERFRNVAGRGDRRPADRERNDQRLACRSKWLGRLGALGLPSEFSPRC